MHWGESCVLCRASLRELKPEREGARRCARCDHVWFEGAENVTDTNSCGDWEKDYYGDDKVFEYHKERSSGCESMVARLGKVFPERGRLLDIGAGVGMMMQAALKDGWTVEGVEPSAKAAMRAQQATGALVHVGFLESVDLQEDCYDAISMVDVLRHVPDVNRFLARAKTLLRPGGLFLVREGNRRILQSISGYREWLKGNLKDQSSAAKRICTDCHSFSPASMRYVLRQAGCVECWVEPSPPFLELAPGGNPVVPILKRFVTVVAGGLYWASHGRVVATPGMLGFGRIAAGFASLAVAG